ncbi:MAG: 3-phosphoshikimate 1-carboxyvinyltransferase [Lachnospiraceae bacterium]|nr:3-phosphoshikimate 1-carboxyvinyltransferase [Lachnospiraceae bacterium]
MSSDYYKVTPVTRQTPFTVTVPGSKSITNRAMLLAALSDGECILKNALFSSDSRALLAALQELGIPCSADEDTKEIKVTGCGGTLPNKTATVNAMSAGTAARFLTALLAFCDGTYTLEASKQMKKRPMAPLIDALSSIGISITPLENEGHLPLLIHGGQKQFTDSPKLSVSIDQSSQFLSALMMTGILLPKGLTVTVTGSRTAMSYVHITERMMKEFGVTPVPVSSHGSGTTYRIPGGHSYRSQIYDIEPDISGACYFYAAAALLGTSVTVTGVHKNSMQGDLRFLSVLEQLGCTVIDTPEGICVTGPSDGHFPGLDITMSDFSDQTMTMAVLALFADSPTHIRGVGHIRAQECDRMTATISEIKRLGGDAKEDEDGTGILITPQPLHSAQIETYDDHRMAMAFALAGLRVEGVIITNPSCCKKTFENYFDLFTRCFSDAASHK